ncbi:MAG: hypothetical protein NTV54_07740, partial [Ignavibacteriales bacterium]|nr:hypothetical protein [Ignavibacteriales bacterium]
MKKFKILILMMLAFFVNGSLRGQVSLISFAGYQQNFDGLSNSGSIAAWSENTTVPGWYAYHGRQTSSYSPGAPKSYFVDDGSSSTGGEGLRGYGSLVPGQTNPMTDRALGELSSDKDTIQFSFAV